MNDEKVVCCFCNESVSSTYIDPCDLNLLVNWDKPENKQRNQTFWCHFACFKERLHRKIKGHVVLDLLSYDDEDEDEDDD